MQPNYLYVDCEDSGWADAQADWSHCWVHRSFCYFCHAAIYLCAAKLGYSSRELIFFFMSKIEYVCFENMKK